ncbi:hypothetical protein OPV22_033125 [Ensete ventricosum]|uniref:CASP-like protein n=1 Tax=Ensete ventricosum TaxID=4639 RepID=A0AAV8Q169_ENSVE|nr:hypothetical protein OPV22_033125 [Ensete ventricosum]
MSPKWEAIMMCLLILAMDGAAGFLGMQAEDAQDKGKHVRIIFVECKKPVHKAYLLGLAAAALLALAHALAHVRPCFCSRRRSDTSSSCRRGLSKAALIASWYILRPSYLSELA